MRRSGSWLNNEKRIAVVLDALMAQRNDLVPHQPRNIRRFAERRIAHHIEIQETRKAKRFADAVSARLLHITNEFGCGAEAQAGKQREHTRGRILSFGKRKYGE
jgi:hypothetical protein